MNATDHTEPRAAGDGVRRGTGRDRDEWFALLDAWGAASRQYREIVAWLTGEHDLSSVVGGPRSSSSSTSRRADRASPVSDLTARSR